MQLARTREHYLGAFELLHDAYCRAGLCQPNDLGLRATPYQLLDASQVFVATLRGEVICTLTLVCDNELGLPIEDTYAHEIEARRQHGVNIAEVTCLADRRLSPKRFFQLFSELNRVTAQYAERQGVDEIWVACHPKHAKLYERRLAFTQIGDQRDYPSVLGNPAVALCLDFDAVKRAHPEGWRQYIGETIPDEVLTPEPLASEDVTHFASIAEACLDLENYLGNLEPRVVAQAS